MNITCRLANAIMCLFFGLASYVQHNDEWAILWISVYALPCIMCLVMAVDCTFLYNHRYFHLSVYSMLIMYMFFSLYLFGRAGIAVVNGGQYTKNLLEHQEVKELFGVVIIQSWLLFNIYLLNAQIPFDALINRSAKVVIIVLAMSPFSLWLYHGCFGEREKKNNDSHSYNNNNNTNNHHHQ